MNTSPTSLQTEKAVGIWIRVSTDDQAQGDSPEIHEQRARMYAEMKGWKVKEVYNLAGVSGKKVSDHPEAQRMLGDIRRGHVTGLIFSKLARLARNVRELLDFSDMFQQNKADLISLHESIDTSSPAGRFFYTMIAAMAQWEREEIVDRGKAANVMRIKMGLPLNGTAPYGFHWKDKKLVVQPEEAPIRKLAYELFLKHRRKGTVARDLNERGFRTRVGKPWSDMAIGRILQDSTAKGLYQYNCTKKIGSWKTEEKPQSEWGCLSVEPIVAEDIWTQVNQIIEEQLKKTQRPGKKPVHLFAGLAFCSCGQRMYVPANTPKYVCFGCRNKIPITDLEAIFYDELKTYFTNPDRLATHFNAAKQNVNEKEKLLSVQQKELEKVREEMSKTHKLYLAGQITVEGFGDLYKPLEQRLAQLLSGFPKLQAEVDFLKVNRISADEVLHEANALYAQWPKMSVETKRRIVENILERMVIGKDDINITLSRLITSEELINSQQRLEALLARAPTLSRARAALTIIPPRAPPRSTRCG